MNSSLTIEEIKIKVLPVLKQAGVLRSSVFGSVARGEADADSDVDFFSGTAGRSDFV